MKLRYIFSFIILTFLSNLTFGQDKYISCHHTKKKIKPVALTDKQKEDLAKNIARSDTFDIVHYDIHLDVRDYAGDYLIANTSITYVPKMDGVTSITFDLRQLDVDSITSGGVPMTYTHIGSDLQIDLFNPTVTGEESVISIWYQGVPYLDPQWGGFYFQNNYIYNLGIGISTIPPNFGKVWYPCFDTYVERALYDFHVTSDDGWKAYCQGDLQEEVIIDDETVMRHYKLDKPIPTYLSAIAVADYESHNYIHDGANGEVPVRLISKPANQAAMQDKFGNLGEAIDALEYWFGEEYWGTVGYVITVDGAMEHPTNIAYPQSMLGASTIANEDLFSHELGHHWWGDMVSQSTFNHMWLKEGPAEYSSHLLREWLGGEEAYIDIVKDNHEIVLSTAHISDEGFQVLSPIPDAHIYGAHSYNKGASVMHSLRGYMGDELFMEGLQFVLDSTLNGVLSPEKFQTILTLSTGVELEDFFNDWVYKPGFASFEINSVNVVENGGEYANTIEVQQKLRECPDFYQNVPMEITAFDEDFVRHNFAFTSEGEFSSTEFITDFEPIFYVINANNRLNIAKLDHHQEIFEETGSVSLPFTEFKMKVEVIGEPGNVYIEHQWVGADQENLAENIDEISDTHYWIVNGVWDEDTHLEATLNYKGSNENQLDYDLYNETEEFGILAYRANPEDMWTEYPYYSLFSGSLTNGNGAMRVDSLLAGEYALGNGETLNVGINEHDNVISDLQLFPNPVADILTLSTAYGEPFGIDIFDGQGKKVKSWIPSIGNQKKLDVSYLSNGVYQLNIISESGANISTRKFLVE